MSDQPKRPPATSMDFLKWGKEFLKDALAKPAVDERQTRPLGSSPAPAGRKHTTLLSEDALSLLASPRATVSELARLNVVFVDNAHRPIYQALGSNDAPFSAEQERHVLDRCLGCLREVQERLAAVTALVPRGRYEGLPLAQVIETVSTKDLQVFFYFVRENPRFFIGKPLRFSEAFVAWVVDHGDAEPGSGAT